MSVRCGIDLGTTFSAISWYDPEKGRVETIPLDTAEGSKALPSVVYYPGEGEEPVIGEKARQAAISHPQRVIKGIKRRMGTPWKTQPIDGRSYSPQEVSSEILKTLARDARRDLDDDLGNVVITVPAHFADSQRSATIEAGRLARLNVCSLLPEPHAAALAYFFESTHKEKERCLLVYDLGGGTFDITLIRARRTGKHNDGEGLSFETICKEGNPLCGGLDWDRILADIATRKAWNDMGLDAQKDPGQMAAFLGRCEAAKRQLSNSESARISIDAEGHEVEVLRSEFEHASHYLLAKTERMLQATMKEAQTSGIQLEDIEVLLSGGSVRMPMVAQMIRGVIGREPVMPKHPELLVSRGAAYQSFLHAGGTVTSPPPAVDVGGRGPKLTRIAITDIGEAIGVKVLIYDGTATFVDRISEIVPRGAKPGDRFPRTFSTTAHGMTEIPIALFRGSTGAPKESDLIAEVRLTGLPPSRPPGREVRVTLGYDSDLILRGDAVDVETNRKVEIVWDRSKTGS